MHIISVQVSLILVLFAALVCFCNASIVLTATLASGKARLNPEVHDKHTVSQRALDIFSIVPVQIVNVGDCVVLQLDLNRSVQGMILATTSFGSDKVVFSGSIQDGGHFRFSFSSGIWIGQVELADESLRFDILPDPGRENGYLIRSMLSTIYEKDDFPEHLLSREMKEEAGNKRYRAIVFAQSHYTIPSNLRRIDGPSDKLMTVTVDTNNILDVLFLFTPQALVAIGGGQRSMDAMAIYSVQLANDAYANSNVPLRMRSVGAFLVHDATYKEGGFQDELNRLRYTDGILDEDVAQRTALGADSVVLFVANSAYCGLAYQWASPELTYAVVSTQCPSSVVHEVGHNIGCQHDRTSEHSVDAKGYNFGYCWDTSSSTCSRSIMAYSTCQTSSKRTNCPRATYFSSPLITHGALGHTTGVATSDNARVLREQASRATNWALSKRDGGLIFSVQPSVVAVSRCELVTITGWRIGTTGSDIVNVTINGVPVRRIMSQSLDSLQVLTGRAITPGVGDIVVTARSGYATTLEQSFAYDATSGLFRSDFEYSMGPLWTASGALDWTIVRYCNSLPCATPPVAGPSVGAGGSGSFAKLLATESSAETGSLTALFNQNGKSHACVESIYSIGLYYHLWSPNAARCGGSLTVAMQSISSSAWTTILTAETRQANQDDPWLLLRYTFPDPTDVSAIRIVAQPYTGMSMCYYFSSVSVDQIVVNKTSACAQDGCDLKTNYPTELPTLLPSAKPTIAPSSVSPTQAPTFAPTYPLIEVVEQVQFTSTLNVTGITAAQFRSDASNAGLFLRAVGTTLGLVESSLCCVAVVDVPAIEAGASVSLMTAGARVSITYNTSLLVERIDQSNLVSGEENNPSSHAASAVDEVEQRLTKSVASGRLLQALTAVLPQSWSSALVLEPMYPSSFSAARSHVTAATSMPSMAPTSSAATAAVNSSGIKRKVWTGWGLYLGIGATVLTVLCSVYAAYYVFSRKSISVDETEGDQSVAIINASSRDDWEAPPTACESNAWKQDVVLMDVSAGARSVPSSPHRQRARLMPSPSRIYTETLCTSRVSLPLATASSLRNTTKSPLHYGYQPVSAVRADEAFPQAPYQDIIDSVNRASSGGHFDQSSSFETSATPTEGSIGSFEMVSLTSPRYRQGLGTTDTASMRPPSFVRLPSPINIITVPATAVTVTSETTGWSLQTGPGTPRPVTGFSCGVTRANAPHSAPFMHQLLQQQPNPSGVLSRQQTRDATTAPPLR